jgi:hypothetical protein
VHTIREFSTSARFSFSFAPSPETVCKDYQTDAAAEHRQSADEAEGELESCKKHFDLQNREDLDANLVGRRRSGSPSRCSISWSIKTNLLSGRKIRALAILIVAMLCTSGKSRAISSSAFIR